jgi:hypothetical protein
MCSINLHADNTLVTNLPLQIFGDLVPQPLVLEHMKTIDAHIEGRISEFMIRFRQGLFVSSFVRTNCTYSIDPPPWGAHNSRDFAAEYDLSIVDLWSKLEGPADVVNQILAVSGGSSG